MGKKHITAQRVEELHGVSVCCVCLSACVCGRWGRYALNSSAERRETQEPVNNSSNSILFLHDCSPTLPSSTSEYNSRMWKRTCQKLLVRNKVWPVYFRCRTYTCIWVRAYVWFCLSLNPVLKDGMPLSTLEESLFVTPVYTPFVKPCQRGTK